MSEILSDIGEFGLIRRIHNLLQEIGSCTPGVTLGIGDDAASIRPRPGYELLVTCDCLVEGWHYLPLHTTPYNTGRRAMAVNISDIGAMGGQILYALVSLGLKSEMPVADVEEMYRGFVKELNPFGASIVGGNFTKSGNVVFIDITLIGEVAKDNIMRRSAARAGDVILVTGYPGQAAAGLKLLHDSESQDLLDHSRIILAYNVPSHRAREGQAVARSGKARAMIDTSEGFLADLRHICQDSEVGALLMQEKFPISRELQNAAQQLGLDPYHLFLQESDDYELIITCSPDNVSDVCSAVKAVSKVPLSEVGKITESVEEIQLMSPDGTRHPIHPGGWDHFKL